MIDEKTTQFIEDGSKDADMAFQLAQCINEGRKLNNFKGTTDELYCLLSDAISKLQDAKDAL